MAATTLVNDEYQRLHERSLRLASGLEAISETLDDLAVAGAPDGAKLAPLQNIAEGLTKQATRLRDDVFCILVVGDFNNGKSTVLNAMIGKCALPVRAKESTAIITRLRYGTPPRADLVFQDEEGQRSTKTLTLSDFKKTYQFELEDNDEDEEAMADAATIARLGLELDSDTAMMPSALSEDEQRQRALDRFSHIEYAFVYDEVSLCQFGVEIVDSPGLAGSPSARQRTLRWLREADAVVCVLNAMKPLADTERGLIRSVVGPEGSNKVFFVINKWNLIGVHAIDPEQDRADVHEAFMKYLPSYLAPSLRNAPEQRCFFVDALTALKARIGLDPLEAVNGTGFPEFEQALAQFLGAERRGIEAASALDAARRAARTAERQQELILRSLSKTDQELEAQRQAIQPNLDHMVKIGKYMESYLDQQSTTLQDQLVNSLRAKLLALREPKRLAAEVDKFDLSTVLSGWVYGKIALDMATTKVRALTRRPRSESEEEQRFALRLARVAEPQVAALLAGELDDWQKSVTSNLLETVGIDLSTHLKERAAEYLQELAKVEDTLDLDRHPIDIQALISDWLTSVTGDGGKDKPPIFAPGVGGITIDLAPMVVAIITQVSVDIIMQTVGVGLFTFIGIGISGIMSVKREKDVRLKMKRAIVDALDKGLREAEETQAGKIRENVSESFNGLKGSIVASIDQDIASVTAQIDAILERRKLHEDFAATETARLKTAQGVIEATIAEMASDMQPQGAAA